MSPYNYALYQYELGSTDYGNYNDLDIWRSVEGSNWQDEVFGRTGHQTQYNANVSGGSKDFKFNVGFNHNDEKSIMMGSGYEKNNISAKINANLNKWLSIDFNGRMAYTTLDGLNGGADTNESNAANGIVANYLKSKGKRRKNVDSSCAVELYGAVFLQSLLDFAEKRCFVCASSLPINRCAPQCNHLIIQLFLSTNLKKAVFCLFNFVVQLVKFLTHFYSPCLFHRFRL